MLLNTVHRGRWEYIARSFIVIIMIIVIIFICVINIIIGCYNTCNLLNVITMFCVSDRSSDWLHAAKKLQRQFDSWCMMGDVVRKSSCFHASSHGVPVLTGLIAVFTKTIFLNPRMSKWFDVGFSLFYWKCCCCCYYVFVYCFNFLQTNKQIVKLKHWKRKKTKLKKRNQQLLSRISQSRLCFFQLK